MKFLVIFFSFLFSLNAMAQRLDYIRLTMGPKMERYTADYTEEISTIPHVDAGAGFYLGSNLSDHWTLELGILRNDYSARIQFEYNDRQSGEEYLFYDGYVYPTLTSYQLALLPGYHRYMSNKVAWYLKGGLHLFMRRKLSREGSEFLSEEILDDQGNVLAMQNITTYSNDIETSNFLFRGDLGLWWSISESLRLDFSLMLRAGTLPLNSFAIDYQDEEGIARTTMLETRGTGASFNIGMKFDLNP